MKMAGLILAAGKSRRMGAFKPLVTIQGDTLIETIIGTLRSTGIQDVYVVVGHNKELLAPVIEKHKCVAVENLDYNRGMLSSITIGLRNIAASIDACLLMPGDIPLVNCQTIRALKTCGVRNPNRIIHPVYRGKKGHPPLLPMQFMRKMEIKNGEHSFKDILRRYKRQSLDLDVDDPFILQDVDTVDDLKNLNLTHI